MGWGQAEAAGGAEQVPVRVRQTRAPRRLRSTNHRRRRSGALPASYRVTVTSGRAFWKAVMAELVIGGLRRVKGGKVPVSPT